VAELTSNGAHEGTNRYEYGQNNLQSETSLQLDGGVEVNTEHISLGVNIFYNRIANYIFYRKLMGSFGGDSLVDNNGSMIPAFTFSQSPAYLYGTEIHVDVHPHPLDWLHFENNLSLVRGLFNQKIDGSNKIPFIPAARWTSEMRGNFKKVTAGIKNMYAKIVLDQTFEQRNIFTGYETETATPGYALLNAGLGADIVKKNKTILSWYIALNNLTDVAYQSHLSRLKYTEENHATGRMGVFNMGRNIMMRIQIPISGKLQ
jgi:iron complex outermembrane receptor protein